jgi:hypothetical protein
MNHSMSRGCPVNNDKVVEVPVQNAWRATSFQVTKIRSKCPGFETELPCYGGEARKRRTSQ